MKKELGKKTMSVVKINSITFPYLDGCFFLVEIFSTKKVILLLFKKAIFATCSSAKFGCKRTRR
jgi:hypothetical protein